MSDATKRFSADKAQWQWDSAMEIYCEQTGKNPDDLTEQDGDIIWEYSGNHIAHFLTWIIKNDLLSDMHDDVPEDIEAVKAETMTGCRISYE